MAHRVHCLTHDQSWSKIYTFKCIYIQDILNKKSIYNWILDTIFEMYLDTDILYPAMYI